jgi:hypothetical protein
MTKILTAICFVIGAVLVTPTVSSWFMDRPLRSPIQYWLFWDDTQYSAHYSEQNFAKLRIGVSKHDVEGKIGQPIQIIEKPNGRVIGSKNPNQVTSLNFSELPSISEGTIEIIYYYSQPGQASDHWFVRSVAFSTKEEVTRITRSFYAD